MKDVKPGLENVGHSVSTYNSVQENCLNDSRSVVKNTKQSTSTNKSGVEVIENLTSMITHVNKAMVRYVLNYIRLSV